MAAGKSVTLSLGGLTWKQLFKQVYQRIFDDDLFGRAAQLSYYFLLSLFPLLLFLTTLFGYFAGSSKMRLALLEYLGEVLPKAALVLVSNTLIEITSNAGGGKLSFGILAALWAASSGINAISSSLNATFNVKETRAWWHVRLISLFLTIALALLIIVALTLLFYGGDIGEYLAAYFGLGNAFTLTWKIAQYPIVIAFILFAFALLYYFAPNLKNPQWHWITPGAIGGIILWLLVSFGFRVYLHFFDSYSKSYGSLGAVIVLMLWFYFTGLAMLIGGEINSIIEQAGERKSEV